jgi:hypothetical protein
MFFTKSKRRRRVKRDSNYWNNKRCLKRYGVNIDWKPRRRTPAYRKPRNPWNRKRRSLLWCITHW